MKTNKNNDKDNQETWDKVKNRLRKELGDTLYRSWLKPLKLKNINKNTIIFSAETSLVRDRVERQYTDRIISIWSAERPGINNVEVSVEDDQHSKISSLSNVKNKNHKVSSPKNIRITSKEDILISSLDKRLTFENFVVGTPNELAFAAAKRVAEADFVPFNPLFLYGGVGLGKTHLMNATAWVIKKKNPDRKVVYISAEKFMYQFIKALRSKDVMNFKQEFRSVDVLMIDDVQFISGKEHTQEEFFHTFNALVDRGCQIVLSADKSPSDLDGMEERLKSRLGWGLVTDIQPTTYELRLGILQSRAESSGITFPREVLDFIAQKIKSNVRELEGALNRIIAHTTLVGKKITLENTIDVLSDILRANNKLITIEDIQKKVSEHFSVKMSEMFSARRSKSVVIPRQVAMYLSKELTNLSYPEIGRNFGGKDHTTIIHASKKIDKLLNENSHISEDIKLLKSILSN
tara:strand:+ start:1310 stop:2698 length:1389 start_codon:yes stop_codon:yes gene_type:complete